MSIDLFTTAIMSNFTPQVFHKFLLMTATCPPSLREELFGCLGLGDCHIIHAPTDRPEISHNIILSPSSKNSKEFLVDGVKRYLSKHKGTDTRGLVYCRRKKSGRSRQAA